MKPFYQFESLCQENSLIHGVSQKSTNEQLLFSLALHTQEEPKLICANRVKVANLFQMQEYTFIVANQTHSSNIKVIESTSSKGWSSQENAIDNCDGLLTNQRGVVLSILTADCVPILLYDRVQKVVGALHAGWRGTHQQIASKGIEMMQERFHSNLHDIVVAIAPAIGGCCYEVGEDVASHFFEYPRALKKRGEKYNLDLRVVNEEQLLALGIPQENIEQSGICTACSVENYFSYRKEGGCSGRFMSMIGLR